MFFFLILQEETMNGFIVSFTIQIPKDTLRRSIVNLAST